MNVRRRPSESLIFPTTGMLAVSVSWNVATTHPARMTETSNDSRIASRAMAMDVPAMPVSSKPRLTVVKMRYRAMFSILRTALSRIGNRAAVAG